MLEASAFWECASGNGERHQGLRVTLREVEVQAEMQLGACLHLGEGGETEFVGASSRAATQLQLLQVASVAVEQKARVT
jgi:hypothetical protein